MAATRDFALVRTSDQWLRALHANTTLDTTIGCVELSWSVLDFGISYVRARQAGNDALAAEERRRRLANGIVNDVRLAFWTAALGERRQSELRAIAGDIEAAMKRSRTATPSAVRDYLARRALREAARRGRGGRST